MASTLKEFGETAKGLSKNPLGIVALFIVLIYGFASLVVGFSGKLDAGERIPIIWFLVLFPVAVLVVFAWLVSRHHKKLYAPSDFKNEEHFLESRNPDLAKLDFASPQSMVDAPVSLLESINSDIDSKDCKSWSDRLNVSLPEGTPPDIDSPDGRAKERYSIYAESRGYFLAHILEPSQKKGQEYEIFIYLIRHKSKDYCDIDKAEFFFGHYWGNRIFIGKKVGRLIGIRTSAYGPFLCTCRITFRDGYKTSLHRYIDFEMGEYF